MSSNMTRRKIGRALGLLSTGGLAATSGCTKMKNDILDGGTVDVVDTEGTFTESGIIVLRALVKNSSDEHKDRIVVAKVDIEDGDTHKIRKLAELDSGKSQTFEFRFVLDRQLSESIIDYNVFLK